ncbi:MAG: hypothetical protein JWR15_3565, partial [Prosthecobacter sp.]|nr:hypothetical protein [Prosthecobacter sp.]
MNCVARVIMKQLHQPLHAGFGSSG